MKTFMLIGLMVMASSVIKAEVFFDDNDDKLAKGTDDHAYYKNGVKVSFKRSARVLNVTFNSPCDDAEVVIYKDGVPVDDDNLGRVDAGTTESYSVDSYGKGNISVSVIRDGREVWVNSIGQAEMVQY